MKSSVTVTYSQKYLVSPWIRFRSLCQEMRVHWRSNGFKSLISRYGWKFFGIVFCFYLIRDISLYILIPYLVAQLATP